MRSNNNLHKDRNKLTKDQKDNKTLIAITGCYVIEILCNRGSCHWMVKSIGGFQVLF